MRYTLLQFLFLLFSFSMLAQQPIPESRKEGPVNDFANILTSSQQDALARKLVQYADETSTQLVLVTETSLDGQDDFDRAMSIYDAWKIGDEGKDNGVMLYVAKNDRKVRFVTGYGAEGFLPDAMAKRIIENIIVPNFKKGDFYTGIDRAWDAVIGLAKGEYTNDNPPGSQKRDAQGGVPAILIIVVIIAIIFIASRFGGGNDDDDDDGGYYRGGRYDMDRRRRKSRRRRGGGGWIFIPGGGGWSGGGGSSGGGGFGGFDGGFSGGFGGGMSGGGGAGGSW